MRWQIWLMTVGFCGLFACFVWERANRIDDRDGHRSIEAIETAQLQRRRDLQHPSLIIPPLPSPSRPPPLNPRPPHPTSSHPHSFQKHPTHLTPARDTARAPPLHPSHHPLPLRSASKPPPSRLPLLTNPVYFTHPHPIYHFTPFQPTACAQ